MLYTIAAFYRFFTVDDPQAMRDRLARQFAEAGLCGTLLIAREGINATLAGSAGAIDEALNLVGMPRADVKFSQAADKPFRRLKVKVKPEIITFRQPHAEPARRAGTYVAASEWNTLIAQDDVLLLDTRNRYETGIGTFQDALDPGIDTFTQFAAFVRANLDPTRQRKVAMFCTGGIRCEKASAFMLEEGFDQVYHLKGGILKYLETVPPEDSRWQGACYVFDEREAVAQGLVPQGGDRA